MRKCPKCGCKEFEVDANTHDTVTFLVGIDDDGSLETYQTMKEYCGDMDFHDTAECYDCGCNINIGEWEIIEEENHEIQREEPDNARLSQGPENPE